MSLLVEPANKNACNRNEKERRLMAGELKFMSQADYVLLHLGMKDPKARLRPIGQSPSTPSRQASAPLLQRAAPPTPALSMRSGGIGSASGARLNTAGSRALSQAGAGSGGSRKGASAAALAAWRRAAGDGPPPSSPGNASGKPRPVSAGRLSTISDASEPELKPPMQDPVLTVMMKGPPLFSPALCTRAAYHF
mmetsp:Transcript_118636/g.332222  ORF Transcript_118636/g.332222 Transcript_118636/m.332222 type:complete len:194 (+) Transcript_118636:103-684(+)